MAREKICGIYKITSPSGKIYIGKSINIMHRCYDYEKLYCKHQHKLYHSLVKHGWSAHTFEIIHECDKSELNDLEKYYILKFNSIDSIMCLMKQQKK